MPQPDYVFQPPKRPAVLVEHTSALFPVNRIFCVGRNYAAHVREMGFDPDRNPPCYFTKSPAGLTGSGESIDYPPGTGNFHHEIELVVAIGQAGFRVDAEQAHELIFGYACGLDMTRRDLQLAARKDGQPWDLGKDLEGGAVVGTVRPAESYGHPSTGRIRLSVNGTTRQDADLGQMIWSVPEVIAHLSGYYHLVPGDLIFTGTPEGVGPVVPGDTLKGKIENVGKIRLRIAPEHGPDT